MTHRRVKIRHTSIRDFSRIGERMILAHTPVYLHPVKAVPETAASL
jgi:hypothetical protein